MRIIYDIGIRIYWLSAWIISAWNRKAKLWIKGRRGWKEQLTGAFSPGDRVIWFHCASLGEFEQGRPILEETRNRFPDHRILLTFFSPSGYEKRKHYEKADHVMYLPLDTARNARRMVGCLSIEMVIFIKYEFWFHFLRQLNKQKVPVYLASGMFRSGQLFFKWYGGWYRKFLDRFTRIFVQLEGSKILLGRFGINHVTVAGDTRFDRVKELAETNYPHEGLENFSKNAKVIIAGSTWERDEQILEHLYRKLPSDLRWIIAPHELSASHISKLQHRFSDSVLFSQMTRNLDAQTRVVIVDTMGHLSFLYRYGTLAYIGGGFGKGIHNTLEAATYGLPVFFGPAHQKFSEALGLIEISAAFPVYNEKE